jgi:hypothetical protein
MNSLNIDNINFHSPYIVGFDGKAFIFTTDNDITYRVDFELDSNPYFTAYWFNLANPQQMKSPGDAKIAQTVICIIEEFFRVNPDVLLYMCSTDNGQQAQRARLFLRWFNGYKQQKKYAIKSHDVRSTDAEGKPTREYVALIIQRNHPLMNEILQQFDDEIQMFNDNKPEV